MVGRKAFYVLGRFDVVDVHIRVWFGETFLCCKNKNRKDLPDEAIEKRVIWKFGDEDIVRVIVNDNGSATILAVANGTIHVTVTTTDVTCRHLVI